eukprot:gene5634-6818_t
MALYSSYGGHKESFVDGSFRSALRTIQDAQNIPEFSNVGSERRLHESAAAGHIKAVHRWMDKGDNLEGLGVLRRTPLHYAAMNPNMTAINVVETLLSKGVTVDPVDDTGLTPLMWACTVGNGSVVRLLIERRADRHHKDEDGLTAMHVAAQYGSTEAIQALVEMEGGRTAMHEAAIAGHVESMLALLAGCTPHEAPDAVDGLDVMGRSPLHWAAIQAWIDWLQGHYAVVQLLQQRGASVSAVDEEGFTALHHAAEHGHISVGQALIGTSSVELSAMTLEEANTPLHIAVEADQAEMARMLISNMGSHRVVFRPNKACPYPTYFVQIELGNTLLHYAVMNQNLSLTAFLAKMGAPDMLDGQLVAVQNKELHTAVHYAAMSGQADMIEVLLKAAAPELGVERLKGPGGRTALHEAVMLGSFPAIKALLENCTASPPLLEAKDTGSIESIKILLQHGASVHAADESAFVISEGVWVCGDIIGEQDGNTALHDAAASGNVAAVRLLLVAGADIGLRELQAGNTPLHVAVINNHVAAARVMRDFDEDGSKRRIENLDRKTAAQLASSENDAMMLFMSKDSERRIML